MDETICLTEVILNALDKQTLSQMDKRWNSAISFFLLENIICIFESNEFIREELFIKDKIVERNGNKKKVTAMLLKYQGEEYTIKIEDTKTISLIGSKTFPFFEIIIEENDTSRGRDYSRRTRNLFCTNALSV